MIKYPMLEGEKFKLTPEPSESFVKHNEVHTAEENEDPVDVNPKTYWMYYQPPPP